MAEEQSMWTSLGTEPFIMTVASSTQYSGMTIKAFSGEELTENGCMLLEQDSENTEHSIISKEVEFYVSVITSGVLVPLLFFAGVPGNVLTAAVFYKQGLKERINMCIFYLAVVDLLNITVSFFLAAEITYRALVGPSGFFITYFTGLTGFTWVSMFLSAVIASERCFCVVSPLRAQRVLSTKTMGVFITISSAILLTGMLVIAGPKHTTACVFDPLTNTTSQIIYVTKYYQDNKVILDILDVFLYAMALPFIFLVIIVVTTTITAVKLRSAAKWRRKITSSNSATMKGESSKENREVALTKMLIGTSTLFVLCICPMQVVQVAMYVVPDLQYGSRYHSLTALLWTIIPVFRCMNSSLNFFVYYRMGSRFRYTLRQLLCCKRVKTGATASPATVFGCNEVKDAKAEDRQPRVYIVVQDVQPGSRDPQFDHECLF